MQANSTMAAQAHIQRVSNVETVEQAGRASVQTRPSGKHSDGGGLWLVNPATHSDYLLAKRLALFIGLWFVRPLFAHVIDPALDPRPEKR